MNKLFIYLFTKVHFLQLFMYILSRDGSSMIWCGGGGGCSGADCRVVSVMCAARPSTTVFEL